MHALFIYTVILGKTLKTATCFDPRSDHHQGVCTSNDLV